MKAFDAIVENEIATFALQAHTEYADLRTDDIVALMPDHPLLAGDSPQFAGVVMDVDLSTGCVQVLWADRSSTLVDVRDLQRIDVAPLLEMIEEAAEHSGDLGDFDDLYDDDDDVAGHGSANAMLRMLAGSDMPARNASGHALMHLIHQTADGLAYGGDDGLQAIATVFCALHHYTPELLEPGESVNALPDRGQFGEVLRGNSPLLMLASGMSGGMMTIESTIDLVYAACVAHVAQSGAAAREQAANQAASDRGSDRQEEEEEEEQGQSHSGAAEARVQQSAEMPDASECSSFLLSSDSPPPVS